MTAPEAADWAPAAPEESEALGQGHDPALALPHAIEVNAYTRDTPAGPILEALNRGEYAVYLSSNHTDVIAQRKAGAPVKQIKPTDGVGITQGN